MARERLLIRTLLELADTDAADHDFLDRLFLLCERAVDVVKADAGSVVLMNRVGDLQVVAATSDLMRELTEVEVRHRQGPCVDAHRAGERVEEADLEAARGRWPVFASEAVARGLASVHARPLCVRDQSIGALTVLRRTKGGLGEDDAAVLAGFADMAAIGIAHARALSTAEQQVSELQGALDKRAVVDQAVAVLADRLDVDQGAAFQWLRGYARNHNRRLRDVSQRFLQGELGTDTFLPC